MPRGSGRLAPGEGAPGGPSRRPGWGAGHPGEAPESSSAAAVGLQPVRVTSSTPAPCCPGPSKSTSPTNSSFVGHEGGGRQPGQAPRGPLSAPGRSPHPKRPAASPEKDPVHLPAPSGGAQGLPHQLAAAALHHEQLQEAWQGITVGARPAPVLRPGALTPHPRTGQRAQRDGGTSGVTLQIVNQAELAAGARGAKGGCERPGLLGQLPPGPLHSQEVPWGEQASELVPPRDPDSVPSLRRGGSWKAGPRPSRAEPHQQPRGRPGWASPCPGPGGAPTAAAPHWRPPSPRLRVTRSPWCLQGQGAWMGLGPRQPLPEGRLGEGRGGPWPAHHIPARPHPPGIAAGSHTAAPGGHTGPHRRSVRARRSSEAAGWVAGARGLGPSTLEVDPPALWASAGVRWVGGACASPRVGREGAQQAHLGLACSGWTG